MEDPKAEDPKPDKLWPDPESLKHDPPGPSGQACQCFECQSARAKAVLDERLVAEYEAGIRSLRAQLAQSEAVYIASKRQISDLREQLAKAEAVDTIVRLQLDTKDKRIRQLIESQADDGRRHFQHTLEFGRQLSASQDLSRALTWALQQAYRASTIRGEDSSGA